MLSLLWKFQPLNTTKNGKPSRAKWRILALGNLDPHTWSTNECFAPIMSMINLCLIVSLTVYHKHTLHSGYVKQAFYQTLLTPDAQYSLCPPTGCLNTPKNTLWLLKRTLYSLEQSPRHWYVKISSFLKQCGQPPALNNPCVFRGSPNGVHELYLGLYVDDSVYFSPCRETEI